MTSLRCHRAPALLLVIVASIAAVSLSPASATIQNRAQIERNFKALKLLPNAASPASTVTRLVTKLVKLDPRRAVKYDKVGIKKIGNPNGTLPGNITLLAARIFAILKNSGLPQGEIASLTIQINNLSIVGLAPPLGEGI